MTENHSPGVPAHETTPEEPALNTSDDISETEPQAVHTNPPEAPITIDSKSPMPASGGIGVTDAQPTLVDGASQSPTLLPVSEVSTSHLVGPSDNQHEPSPPRVVCLIFPTKCKKQMLRKLYIKLDLIKNIAHFQDCEYFERYKKPIQVHSFIDLDYLAPPVITSQPSTNATTYPSIGSLIQAIQALFTALAEPLVARLKVHGHSMLKRLPPLARLLRVIGKCLVPCVCSVGLELCKLLSSYLASAFELVVWESIQLVNSILNEKDDDLLIVQQMWIITSLGRVRNALEILLTSSRRLRASFPGQSTPASSHKHDCEELDSLCDDESKPVGHIFSPRTKRNMGMPY